MNQDLVRSEAKDLEYFYVKTPDELPFFAANPEVISLLHHEPLLIISRGEKPGGGYGFELIGTEIRSDHLMIELISSDPKPGSVNILMLTYPFVYVRTYQAKTFSLIVNGELLLKERRL